MPFNSIAVITGGAGDIGQAICTKLAETHDHVVFVDINESKGEELSKSLDRGKFSFYRCDVTDQVQVGKMGEFIQTLGIVTTLVNNAGGTRIGSLQEMTPDVWKSETALNLEAAYLCFHAFEKSLKQARGKVINIASVNGFGSFGNPAYSAAKAGLIHFTKSIAVEYGKFGIRANAIAPGTVRTHAWDEKAAGNPQVFQETMKWYPLKRIIQPKDIANAAAFLINEEADAITGITLPVDSGLTAGQTQLAGTFSQSEYY